MQISREIKKLEKEANRIKASEVPGVVGRIKANGTYLSGFGLNTTGATASSRQVRVQLDLWKRPVWNKFALLTPSVFA